MFDLDSKSFRGSASADGGEATDELSERGTVEDEITDGSLDPDAESVLDAVQETEIGETSPVELMSKVEEWQRQLDDTGDNG